LVCHHIAMEFLPSNVLPVFIQRISNEIIV
jgi:hypothetical protein